MATTVSVVPLQLQCWFSILVENYDGDRKILGGSGSGFEKVTLLWKSTGNFIMLAVRLVLNCLRVLSALLSNKYCSPLLDPFQVHLIS